MCKGILNLITMILCKYSFERVIYYIYVNFMHVYLYYYFDMSGSLNIQLS